MAAVNPVTSVNTGCQDANGDGVTTMVADRTHLFDLVIFEFSEVIGQ